MKRDDLVKLKSILTQASGQLKPEFVGKPHEEIAAVFKSQVSDAADADSVDAAVLVEILLSNYDEYAALTDKERTALQLAVSCGTIRVGVRQWLRSLFPADGSKVKRQINQAFRRAGTYAESVGVPIPTNNDIADILVRGEPK